MTAESDLATHFEAIGLPASARAWLLDLWGVIQVLDDAYDGDRSDDGAVMGAIKAIFLTMPLNDFYRQYSGVLQAVAWLQVLKWQAANDAEDAGEADEKSYVWRAGYYDVVLMACHLCGVEGAGRACMRMYGETFAEYMEDQKCQGH